MAPRVLVLGASRYYVGCIRAARDLGFEVVAVDRDPGAPGADLADRFEAVDFSDVGATLEVARRHEVDGVVPLNDFGVPTASAVAAELGLVGLDPEAARIATDKRRMREVWEEADLGAVEFRVADSLAGARDAARGLGAWPLVVKPADSRGGGSRGVSVVRGEGELAEAFEFARAHYPDSEVLVEEFADGSEHSVETLAVGGEVHVLAVSDKEKTELPYRVDRSVIYPTSLPPDRRAALGRAVERAVQAVGIRDGAAHVELAMTDEGPALFELGARCGGGATPDLIVPWVSGVPMFQELVRISVGQPPGDLEPRHERGCVYRFLTPEPGRVAGVRGLEDVRAREGVLDCAVTVGPGDTIEPVRTGHDRAGFVVAAAETREEAIGLADACEARIRFVYEGES